MLLLDEPSSGIAQRETEALGDAARRLKEALDVTMVVIEHDIPLIMALSDRIIAMESGRVIAEGTPDEVRSIPRVIESYLGGDLRAIERLGQGGRPRRRRARRWRRSETGKVAALLTLLAFAGRHAGSTASPSAPTNASTSSRPTDQSTVALPVTIRWTAKDLSPRTSFAVFVDQKPMAPGKTFRSVADDQCKTSPTCPDATYLTTKFIFPTEATSIVLTNVPADDEGERFGSGHTHTVTIVLMRDGRRLGESAFAVDFFLEEASPPAQEARHSG